MSKTFTYVHDRCGEDIVNHKGWRLSQAKGLTVDFSYVGDRVGRSSAYV